MWKRKNTCTYSNPMPTQIIVVLLFLFGIYFLNTDFINMKCGA